MRQEHREERVTGLMDGRDPLFFFGHDHGLSLDAHQDLVLGVLEVRHPHDLLIEARGVQRGFVHEVGEIGAREPGGAAREHPDVDVVGQRNLASVNRENAFAAFDVGAVDDDAPIEATRPEQRGIQDVGAVGGRHEDDALIRLEAIHLDEQLVEGLLALVVAAAEAGAAMTTDGVDLVDEDDAGRVLLALLEEVAHAGGADADEHLDEVRAADREERNVGFASDGARQERFAGSRRAHQQDALGDPAAELLKLLRLLQEVDDLLELFLRFIDAGHVTERDFLLCRRGELGLALSKRQRLVAAALNLAHEEDPEPNHQENRRPVPTARSPTANRSPSWHRR